MCSHTDLHHWDTQSSTLVQSIPLCAATDLSSRQSIWDSQLYFTKGENELFVSRYDPAMTVTYSLPYIVPTITQFPVNDFKGVYMDEFEGIGVRDSGEVCIMNSVDKSIRMLECVKAYSGEGNWTWSTHFSSNLNTIAIDSGSYQLMVLSTSDL